MAGSLVRANFLDRARTNEEYPHAVDRLRGAGCICILRWDADRGLCIPATGCQRHVDRSVCYFVTAAAQEKTPAPCSDADVSTPTPGS